MNYWKQDATAKAAPYAPILLQQGTGDYQVRITIIACFLLLPLLFLFIFAAQITIIALSHTLVNRSTTSPPPSSPGPLPTASLRCPRIATWAHPSSAPAAAPARPALTSYNRLECERVFSMGCAGQRRGEWALLFCCSRSLVCYLCIVCV